MLEFQFMLKGPHLPEKLGILIKKSQSDRIYCDRKKT